MANAFSYLSLEDLRCLRAHSSRSCQSPAEPERTRFSDGFPSTRTEGPTNLGRWRHAIWLVVRGLELVATRSVARAEPSGSEAWTRLSRWILEEPRTWTSERNNLGGRNFSRFPFSHSATKKNSRASGVAWGSWKFFRSSWTWGTAADTKRTMVGDHRVLNSKCPKRLARI